MSEVDLERYDPMDPEIQQDPFPHYAALRRDSPVHRSKTGIFFISRLDTVREVLGRPKVFSSKMSNAQTAPDSETMQALKKIAKQGYPQVDTMLTADPPLQTRFRKTVGRAFTTKRIEAAEPVLRAIATKLLDAWPKNGRVDFANGFAIPFPVRSIISVLGMRPDTESNIKRWSDDSVAALGARLTDERRIEAARGVLEMQLYWGKQSDDARENPRDDFSSALAKATIEDADGEVRLLETAEMISICQQLMVAGNETTTKMLNELGRILAENPEAYQQLRDDPSLIPNAVEEGLRLSSPNQGLFRQVREDVELDGVKVPAGSTVWVMFGAANRDERFFPDPDRFDPTRKNLREAVALGFGAHFCIGAPLARLEGRIALEELVSRYARLSLPEQTLRYEPSYILRGLAALELELET